MVEFLDDVVDAGAGRSRAAVVGRALERERRRAIAERDAAILDSAAPDPELTGLAGPCVVSCDNLTTVPADALGEQIGVLLDRQEPLLGEAIRAAFDLD